MKISKLMVLLVVVLMLSMVVIAYAEECADTNLDALIAEISQDEELIKRMKRWNENDQEVFEFVAMKHGFCLSEADLDDPGVAVLYCFRAVYGNDMAFWTIEQKHQYSAFNFCCGLDDNILHRIPDEDEITIEEATAIARSAILREPDGAYITNWDAADLERCQWVSAEYLADRDLGNHWVISFYQLNDAAIFWGAPIDWRVPTFTVFLWESGSFPQVTYFDPYQMNLIYSYAREYHGRPFRFWSLEQKAEIYHQLIAVYDREMRREGALPGGIINEILAHVQSVPTAAEVQPDVALAYAKESANDFGVDVGECTDDLIAIYFWRDEAAAPVYYIEFYTEEGRILHSVEIQALQ